MPVSRACAEFRSFYLKTVATILPASQNSGDSSMNVLVAGGAGYIGSHTVKRLKEAGHTPVIYDNLSRGHLTAAQILKVPFVAADLNDRATLTQTLREHKIDTVMHFAAYAYVGESVEKP